MANMKELIKKHFDEDSEQSNKLAKLIDDLSVPKGIFVQQMGNYPADHGIQHIEKVIENIDCFLKGLKEGILSPKILAELFAAAIIHDVGMTLMRDLGAYSPEADKVRMQHSKFKIIEDIARQILENARFEQSSINNILYIASAHAQDDEEELHKKLLKACKTGDQDIQSQHALAVHLLRVADFLDLGQNRLIKDKIDWKKKQDEHLKKHLIFSDATISVPEKMIYINLSPDGFEITQKFSKDSIRGMDSMEAYTIIYKTYGEAEEIVDNLNKVLPHKWHLMPVNQELFGKICPLSSGVQLFKNEFIKALRNWESEGKNEKFKIEMMGHSLYQRFVIDSENLNKNLQKILQSGQADFKVLLLDPFMENQQTFEVFKAQQENEKNIKGNLKQRSILPNYFNGELDPSNLGDINETLEKIKSEWKPITGNSFFEVRLTKRLMYASIMRFEDRMIVTPYRFGGLFNKSVALVLTPRSPLFTAYQTEFNSIWDNYEETRLCFIHSNAPDKFPRNPIQRLINKGIFDFNEERHDLYVPSFNYEKWLLKNQERIIAWLKNEPIPPYEIEIQPSSKCNLQCTHCIGRYLGKGTFGKETLKSIEDLPYLRSIFDWEESGFKIERIRISGLTGDPFYEESKTFTIQLIDKARKNNREIVVFTNGMELQDIKVRRSLINCDYVHISLDAGDPETFKQMKHSNDFNLIVENIKQLCLEIKTKEGLGKNGVKTKVGIGFIVTQQNAGEINKVFPLTENLGISFIRFKRDIHGAGAIPSRLWYETRNTIIKERNKLAQKSEYPKIYLTDLPRQYWGKQSNCCWAIRYCVTIGPDGFVYACDHLTELGSNVAFDSLKNLELKQILEDVYKRNDRIKRQYCIQCSPFNLSTNRFLDELNILRELGLPQLQSWLTDACQNL